MFRPGEATCRVFHAQPNPTRGFDITPALWEQFCTIIHQESAGAHANLKPDMLRASYAMTMPDDLAADHAQLHLMRQAFVLEGSPLGGRWSARTIAGLVIARFIPFGAILSAWRRHGKQIALVCSSVEI